MPTTMQVILGKHLDRESIDPRQIGKTNLGTLTTGPRGILSWLGTLLGVRYQDSSHERIIAYQRALAETKDGFFAALRQFMGFIWHVDEFSIRGQLFLEWFP